MLLYTCLIIANTEDVAVESLHPHLINSFRWERNSISMISISVCLLMSELLLNVVSSLDPRSTDQAQLRCFVLITLKQRKPLLPRIESGRRQRDWEEQSSKNNTNPRFCLQAVNVHVCEGAKAV